MTNKKTDKKTKKKEEGVGKAIGIDLGTTFSAVSVMEAGKPTIIPNAEGDRTTPSVVLIKEKERVVGKLARNQAILNPEHTVRSIKRNTLFLNPSIYTPLYTCLPHVCNFSFSCHYLILSYII